MRTIVLASGSPRRKILLTQLGMPFVVEKSNFEEVIDFSLSFSDLSIGLATGKVKAVAEKYPDAILIGADTFVVFENEIFGKPHTPERARVMLERLSGKPHRILTGLCLFDTKNKKMITDSIESRVWMRNMSREDIANYVATGEPLDKAGGYGIQELGAIFVSRIEGDYTNVVGLPLFSLAGHLKTLGISILSYEADKKKNFK